MDLLKGFNVNLYVDEEVFKGTLIGVEADHVVLETENKYIFYYNIDKIQAVTKNTRQFQPEKTTSEFQKTQRLTDLLRSFLHSWITILCTNKQRFSGVLSEIDTDFATLINGEDRIYIKLTYVSNILKGYIKEEKRTQNETTENEQNKNETKNNENEENDEVNRTCQTTENKTGNNSKQTAREKSTSFENKEKTTADSEYSEKQPKVAAVEEIFEPLITTELSHSKNKVTLQIDDHISKSRKRETSVDTEHKGKTDRKKQKNEKNNKKKKTDEPSIGKAKPIEPAKEMKPVKETVIKVETKPADKLPSLKKEAIPSKSQETTDTTKPVLSHTTANRKTEDTNSDRFENDTKNVWGQKDEEKRTSRFSGEPVTPNKERAFPFAGWPNRNKKT
ncbi:hypothetical protein V7150_21555 [Neobacillus drentensis]|uniref:hypothetical protein n=1 Tax=Neobacillus drentensis TaxID=220684 RepID=UPI002FFFCB7B